MKIVLYSFGTRTCHFWNNTDISPPDSRVFSDITIIIKSYRRDTGHRTQCRWRVWSKTQRVISRLSHFLVTGSRDGEMVGWLEKLVAGDWGEADQSIPAGTSVSTSDAFLASHQRKAAVVYDSHGIICPVEELSKESSHWQGIRHRIPFSLICFFLLVRCGHNIVISSYANTAACYMWTRRAVAVFAGRCLH